MILQYSSFFVQIGNYIEAFYTLGITKEQLANMLIIKSEIIYVEFFNEFSTIGKPKNDYSILRKKRSKHN